MFLKFSDPGGEIKNTLLVTLKDSYHLPLTRQDGNYIKKTYSLPVTTRKLNILGNMDLTSLYLPSLSNYLYILEMRLEPVSQIFCLFS